MYDVDEAVEKRQKLGIFSDSRAKHDPVPSLHVERVLDVVETCWGIFDDLTEGIDPEAAKLCLNTLCNGSIQPK